MAVEKAAGPSEKEGARGGSGVGHRAKGGDVCGGLGNMAPIWSLKHFCLETRVGIMGRRETTSLREFV